MGEVNAKHKIVKERELYVFGGEDYIIHIAYIAFDKGELRL